MSETNSPKQKILVIGAGELGLSILRSLSYHERSQDLSLNVLLRPNSTPTVSSSRLELLDTLSSLSVTPIYLDLSAPAPDMVSTFQGFDIVVSCAGMTSPPGTETKLVQAVIEARVGRYVPWQFGVDYDAYDDEPIVKVFKESKRVRELLRSQSSIKWTIISTGIFMSYIFEPAVGIVELPKHKEGGIAKVRALGDWENKLTITSVEDIGRLTSSILVPSRESSDETEEGIVKVAGDTITYDQIAIAVERVGWKVERELWSIDKLRQDLRDLTAAQAQKESMEEKIIRYRIMCAEGKGMSWTKGESWNGRRGVKTESLDEWVKRCLPAPGAL